MLKLQNKSKKDCILQVEYDLKLKMCSLFTATIGNNHFATAWEKHCALWQPPRYAGSWPSCPFCSSRRQAWGCRWPDTQTMPPPLTLRSGLLESWWILGALKEKTQKREREKSTSMKLALSHLEDVKSTPATVATPPLTTPHFTISDRSGWLVSWRLHGCAYFLGII